MGGDFLRLDLAEKCADQRVFHAAGNRLNRQDFAGVGDDLMPGVEDADLHRLIIVDIRGEGRADPVPIGSPGAEIVLDHPLAEILMRHRHLIGDAEPLCQRQFGRAGGGDDAIDHRIRKRAVGRDPVGKTGVREAGEAKDRLLQHPAVALKVVAALAGKGALPGVAAQP